MFVIPAPEAISFTVFNIPIYWYGITMALAIFTSMVVGNKLYNLVNLQIRRDVIIEYAPLIIVTGIVCARLYFCLLNHNYYLSHLGEILDIRQGGLSIHGALIGGVASLIYVAKKCKISVMSILDAMGCATILGQSIGRWGNYFNSEAYGLPVKGQDWGLFVPESKRVFEYADFSLFHPAFLYESISDLFAFGLLLLILLKFGKRYRGLVLFSYLVIYSVIRFFIEQIRVDSALNLASIPVAELVSIVLFFVGILGILITLFKNK